MKKQKCKYCKKENHTSIMCYLKPRVPLRQESDKHRKTRMNTRRAWLEKNPPDNKGLWYCYLRISPLCPYRLTGMNLTLEHVRPKGSNPHLAHDLDNIKPACSPCNVLKGSKSINNILTSRY